MLSVYAESPAPRASYTGGMHPRLAQAFEDGTLYRPQAEDASFVDLVNALAAVTDASPPNPTDHVEQLVGLLGGTPEHVVFVLVDGMGDRQLEHLPEGSFLRGHRQRGLRSVFPSTTACATASLATGLWPAQHGVTGWWAYLAERDLPITVLPFVERFTGESLTQQKVYATAVWRELPLLTDMGHEPMVIQPEAKSNGVFCDYLSGYRARKQRQTMQEAVDMAIERVREADTPSYTYVYLPEFDALCHQAGAHAEEATALLVEIDAQLARLAEAVGGKATLVVSADHGYLDIPVAERHGLEASDPLNDYLVTPVTGEPRTPLFFVKDGQHEAFIAAFDERFGDRFALLAMDEVESLGLLGPGPMTPFARKRFGDFMAIALQPATLLHVEAGWDPAKDHASEHAGLTHDETAVPMVVV